MNGAGIVGFTLLERLAAQAHCTYMSDLKFLKGSALDNLLCELERIPSCAASLSEWNDALLYLTCADPQPDCETARRKLLDSLGASL